MWSEKDGFFYDVLTYPDGRFAKFRVRSLVGIIPLYATEVIEEKELDEFPEFKRNFLWFLENRKDLVAQCITPLNLEGKKDYLLALMSEEQMESVLRYIWDPEEFRSTFGMRSLSKFHPTPPLALRIRKSAMSPGNLFRKSKGETQIGEAPFGSKSITC